MPSAMPRALSSEQVREHLWHYLKERLASLLAGNPLPTEWPQSLLKLGLMVLFSVRKFNLPVSDEDLGLLCRCLHPRSATDTFWRDLDHIYNTPHR